MIYSCNVCCGLDGSHPCRLETPGTDAPAYCPLAVTNDPKWKIAKNTEQLLQPDAVAFRRLSKCYVDASPCTRNSDYMGEPREERVLKVKFFSKDAGMMLDVTHIDIMNNKFTVKYGDQKITLDNIDQLLLDTGDKLIKFSEFKET